MILIHVYVLAYISCTYEQTISLWLRANYNLRMCTHVDRGETIGAFALFVSLPFSHMHICIYIPNVYRQNTFYQIVYQHTRRYFYLPCHYLYELASVTYVDSIFYHRHIDLYIYIREWKFRSKSNSRVASGFIQTRDKKENREK